MSSALDEAKRKLSQGDPPFHYNDLPDERNDVIWSEIMRMYSLTLPELSALKNARCLVVGMGSPQRGQSV